jgi:hypothetical protein
VGDWKKFHMEELHNLYSSPNITSVMKIKLEVKLPLCLTKHHTMKEYWGVDV